MSVVKNHPVKSIPFTKQFGFRKAVIQRVNDYMKQENMQARDLPAMYGKTVVMFAWWMGSFALLYFTGLPFWAKLPLWVSFGLATAGIGFNVMHDANHDGYSKHPLVNKILGW